MRHYFRRSIHDNLHLVHYSLENVRIIAGKRMSLVNLDQTKVFDRVDHWYLVVLHKEVGLFAPLLL